MFLGRVQGRIVATAKDPAIAGKKLLVIEPLKVAYDRADLAGEAGDASSGGGGGRGKGWFEPTGRAIVALDLIGAGQGQLVLITQGSSARMAEGCNEVPTDAVVVGIVDEAHLLGHEIETP